MGLQGTVVSPTSIKISRIHLRHHCKCDPHVNQRVEVLQPVHNDYDGSSDAPKPDR